MKQKKNPKKDKSPNDQKKSLSQIFKETPFSYDRIGKSFITKKYDDK